MAQATQATNTDPTTALKKLLPGLISFVAPGEGNVQKMDPNTKLRKSFAWRNFVSSPLGEMFLEKFGSASEHNLLTFLLFHYEEILKSGNDFISNFVALLIEVSAGDKTDDTKKIKNDILIAKIGGNPKAIDAAIDALEKHRNSRAPHVKGVSIGREMMTHVRGLFEQEVKQLQFEAAQAKKPQKPQKLKKKAGGAARIDEEVEVVDLF